MQKRRLAAIMFTDIVGYTALMGSDEDRAFEVLHKNREIHTELIQKFKGTLIKEMGDGMLVSFNLASDAVSCAIEIQKRAREELKGQIRIGIHLGDITFENEDVFGDGVNIASRLQSITDPGGIYLSESLQKSIRGKSNIQTKYLGEFNLKNVDYLVKTYAVQGAGLPVPSSAKIKSLKKKNLKDRIFGSAISYIIFLILLVSIVWGIRSTLFEDKLTKPKLMILSLENYTGSDTLEYITAGIHNSLIGEIGKIGELNIISPYTSRSFKDSGKSLKEIASEANVDYIIEPSLSCFGDNVCLKFIMTKIDSEEEQIWVEDYYEDKSQIFNMYNKITKEISKKINIILSPLEDEFLAASRDVDPEAYEAYLKGQYYWEKLDWESMLKAVDYFELAIEIDPEWADPYAGLANAWSMFGGFFGTLPKSETLPKKYKYLNKALELDPNSAQAHYVKALNAVWTEFDWEQGEKEFLKVIELNPNDALNRMYYAHLLMILRRTDEAIYQANQALKLDPLRPLVLGLGGIVMRNEGDIQSATLHLEKALSIDPNFGLAKDVFADIQMRAAYKNGDYEKWIELWEKKVRGHWWNDEGRAAVINVFHEKGHIAAIEEMFRMNEKYGNACFMRVYTKADRYLKLGEYDKVMDCFEQEYEKRDLSITYIAANKGLFDQLKDNTRYIALLKKMNLPLP